MTDDSYRGESPAKKYARIAMWGHIADVVGYERFKAGKHLVLASREGGDVSALLGMRVKPENIVAVDHCESAAKECEARHGVKVRVADVAEVLLEHRQSLLTAFLDFCSPPQGKFLDALRLAVVNSIEQGGVMACGFLRAREKNIVVKRAMAEMIDRYNEAEASGLPDFHIEPGTEMLRAIANANPKEGADEYDAELAKGCYAVHKFMLQAGRNHRIAVHKVALLTYHSAIDGEGGSPMSFAAFGVARYRRTMNLVRFLQRAKEAEYSIIKGGQVLMGHFGGRSDVSTHVAELRRRVLAVADKPNVCQLFNISPRQLAAWKAHAARGTYDKTG